MHCAQAGSPPLTYVESLVRNFPSPVRNSSQVPDAAAVERLYACTKRHPVPNPNPNPNPNQVPDALDVYRRVLAASPARSVTIASVGLLTLALTPTLSPTPTLTLTLTLTLALTLALTPTLPLIRSADQPRAAAALRSGRTQPTHWAGAGRGEGAIVIILLTTYYLVG